ncbi:MAG TPA: CocE/NonD family hydrolase [Actinomycetota bacterium]
MRVVADDGVALDVTVDLPEAPGPSACVVALHAAAFGERAHPLYDHLRDTLVPTGAGVVVYDRRGSGASGGVAEVPLGRLAEDALAVVHAVGDLPEVDAARIGVWGISQGGWLGPMAAGADDAIAFVVAVSASGVSPSVQMHFAMENVLREHGFGDAAVAAAHDVRSRIEAALRAGDAVATGAAIEEAGHEPWSAHAYLPSIEDVEQPDPFEIDLDAAAVFASVRVPTLAIYGAWDRWVPIEPSVDAWRTAFADRPGLLTVERIDGVGHMMTTPDDPRDPNENGPIGPAYGAALRAWIARVAST